jgi:hypothetical protein
MPALPGKSNAHARPIPIAGAASPFRWAKSTDMCRVHRSGATPGLSQMRYALTGHSGLEGAECALCRMRATAGLSRPMWNRDAPQSPLGECGRIAQCASGTSAHVSPPASGTHSLKSPNVMRGTQKPDLFPARLAPSNSQVHSPWLDISSFSVDFPCHMPIGFAPQRDAP